MLLNALVHYGSMYGDPTTSDINLGGILSSLSILAQHGQFVRLLRMGRWQSPNSRRL